MVREIAPATLHHLIERGSTLALLDVREPGEYNTAHIPGASLLPRRQIEFRLERLVPARGVQVVLCDDDGRRARLAANTVERMGYTRVAVLDGGTNAWSVEGFPTEWGMNVISKDFGERVEVQAHVPTIGARELNQRLQRGDPLVILDTRTPEEYRRFCIPGGRSVPGGELALRITDIVREQPDATVIVNCAGRTRSIIGARVLQRMGLPNVLSLRNGTSGWVLAGLELEQDAGRVDLQDPSPEGRAAAEAFALRVAEEDGVRLLSIDELDALLTAKSDAPVYRVDVRTEAEFAHGHIPGFWWFPGGQAVQRADDVAAVRNGTIIFACDGITRAAVTASWYRQLGFPNVYAVRGGVTAWKNAGRTIATGPDEAEPFGLTDAASRIRSLDVDALESMRASARPPLLFVDPSNEFARGHIPGSHWLPRGWLEPRVTALAPNRDAPLVVTDTDGRNAFLAAATLMDLGYTDVAALAGGMAAWSASGRAVEQGLTGVMQPPDDVVPAGPDRSYADMIHYLHWEERLGEKYGDATSTSHG
jgi:rhodanese-related sulfurtransferase